MAAVLALLAALFIAISDAVQQRLAHDVSDDERVGPIAWFTRLLRNPRWWLGSLIAAIGFALQAAALGVVCVGAGHHRCHGMAAVVVSGRHTDRLAADVDGGRAGRRLGAGHLGARREASDRRRQHVRASTGGDRDGHVHGGTGPRCGRADRKTEGCPGHPNSPRAVLGTVAGRRAERRSTRSYPPLEGHSLGASIHQEFSKAPVTTFPLSNATGAQFRRCCSRFDVIVHSWRWFK